MSMALSGISSVIMSPEVSSEIQSQMVQLSYIFRNIIRINGETVGLPKAIPDHRKGDYLFRDYYMTFVMTSLMDIASRLAESQNVMPPQVKLLRLRELSKLYPEGGIHTPRLPSYFQIRNFDQQYPEYLRKYVLGSNVKPRTYTMVPELLEQKVVPEMLKNYEHPARIAEARLMAHHFRRMFNPLHYIDNFLLAEKRVTPTEAKLLKAHIERFKAYHNAYGAIRDKGNPDALRQLLATLEKEMPVEKIGYWPKYLAGLSTQDLRTTVKGQQFHVFWKLCRKKGFKKAIAAFKQERILNPDRFMLNIDRKILRPYLAHLTAGASQHERDKLLAMAKSFSRNMIRADQARSVFQASEAWIKLPISVALLTAVYGIISGYIDVKYVQAYQDQLVKLRGDAKDTVMPTYVGTVAGLLLGFSLYRSKMVRSLGHVGSYVVAALGYNVGQIGTTWFLLKHRLATPRYQSAQSDPARRVVNLPNWDEKDILSSANPIKPIPPASEIKNPR